MSDEIKPEYFPVEQATRYDLFGTAITKLMTDHCISNGLDFMKTFGLTAGDPDKNGLNVVLTINGVQVSVKPFFEYYVKHFDELLRKEAKMLIDEKASDLWSAFNEFERNVKEKSFQLFGREYDE